MSFRTLTNSLAHFAVCMFRCMCICARVCGYCSFLRCHPHLVFKTGSLIELVLVKVRMAEQLRPCLLSTRIISMNHHTCFFVLFLTWDLGANSGPHSKLCTNCCLLRPLDRDFDCSKLTYIINSPS